jgi:hypothetical protein
LRQDEPTGDAAAIDAIVAKVYSETPKELRRYLPGQLGAALAVVGGDLADYFDAEGQYVGPLPATYVTCLRKAGPSGVSASRNGTHQVERAGTVESARSAYSFMTPRTFDS